MPHVHWSKLGVPKGVKRVIPLGIRHKAKTLQ